MDACALTIISLLVAIVITSASLAVVYKPRALCLDKTLEQTGEMTETDEAQTFSKSGPDLETKSESDVLYVPKSVWTYWDGELPRLIEGCISTWKHYNPSWAVHVLNRNSAEKYVGKDVVGFRAVDSPARASDFVRLHVLAKHGGLWLDASIIATQPFETWLAPTGFTGFQIQYPDRNRPVLESWAFACPKACPFVRRWRDALCTMNDFDDAEAWVAHYGVLFDLSNVMNPDYLSIHCAAEIVRQSWAPAEDLLRRRLFNAEDTAFAWWLRSICTEDSFQECVRDLNDNKHKQAWSIVKLCRFHREAAEQELDPTKWFFTDD